MGFEKAMSPYALFSLWCGLGLLGVTEAVGGLGALQAVLLQIFYFSLSLSLSASLRVEIGWGWIGFDGFWKPFVKSSRGEKLQEGGALCGMAMCRMQQKKHNSW